VGLWGWELHRAAETPTTHPSTTQPHPHTTLNRTLYIRPHSSAQRDADKYAKRFCFRWRMTRRAKPVPGDAGCMRVMGGDGHWYAHGMPNGGVWQFGSLPGADKNVGAEMRHQVGVCRWWVVVEQSCAFVFLRRTVLIKVSPPWHKSLNFDSSPSRKHVGHRQRREGHPRLHAGAHRQEAPHQEGARLCCLRQGAARAGGRRPQAV